MFHTSQRMEKRRICFINNKQQVRGGDPSKTGATLPLKNLKILQWTPPVVN